MCPHSPAHVKEALACLAPEVAARDERAERLGRLDEVVWDHATLGVLDPGLGDEVGDVWGRQLGAGAPGIN